jgi:hypothetical protein
LVIGSSPGERRTGAPNLFIGPSRARLLEIDARDVFPDFFDVFPDFCGHLPPIFHLFPRQVIDPPSRDVVFLGFGD